MSVCMDCQYRIQMSNSHDLPTAHVSTAFDIGTARVVSDTLTNEEEAKKRLTRPYSTVMYLYTTYFSSTLD